MRTYKAFYKGRSIEVQAMTSLEAQEKAAATFRAKKNWEVAVVLCDVPLSTSSL